LRQACNGWCGSTEKLIEEADVHKNIYAFEAGLKNTIR